MIRISRVPWDGAWLRDYVSRAFICGKKLPKQDNGEK